ncbi:hydrogenase maturation protease [Merismopedia glauca]|uniref:Hydrogenase maturation protease n=1 Tax=Merismopedia glauca CCAP 1448/3 TaxID=1296344 RepID=A0A2T1C3G0_9CYAN|nr:hydrogenase maturation protease [Merismopedia glauca]PSB02744.1 hydrogenase maturation protease [Merismopedia glauca CCAP 1448/3]
MKTLVIGYGNTLRSDDGVGFLVAEEVAEWNLPNLRSLAVHQLLPELAAEIAQVEEVFFIDAWEDLGNEHHDRPRLERLQPNASPCSLDHSWSPSVLLHLASTLYHSDPVAYQILIPARQFDFGTSLSAIAKDGMDWSLNVMKAHLTTDREQLPCTKLA